MKKAILIILGIVLVLGGGFLIVNLYPGIYFKLFLESKFTDRGNTVLSPKQIIPVSLPESEEFVYDRLHFRAPWTGASIKETGNANENGLVITFVNGQKIRIGRSPQEYKELKAMLQVTPRDIGLLDSNKEVVRKSALLTLKNAALASLPSPVFSFQTGSIRGFQFGGEGKLVYLMVYDENDNGYDLMVSDADVQEIDAILSSVQVK